MAGKLSDTRYAKMATKYEDEAAALSRQIGELNKELHKENSHVVSADEFLFLIRRYENMQELTREIVTALISRIDVWHVQDRGGEKVQHVKIHDNFVGPVTLPEKDKLPKPQIKMDIRKGVAVNYADSYTTL